MIIILKAVDRKPLFIPEKKYILGGSPSHVVFALINKKN